MKEKTHQIFIHAIICLVFLSLAFIPWFQGKTKTLFNPLAVREFFGYLFLIIIFYLNYFILVPKLYFQQKYILYFLSIVIIYFVFRNAASTIIGPRYFAHISPPQTISGRKLLPPPNENFNHLLEKNKLLPVGDVFIDVNQKIFPFLVIIVFSLMLRISSRWQQTEREKINAELSYLKAQINPHFLFNTLNSIYSLAIMKSDETPNAIVKLSGMMRYVLSESANEFVSLEKEIIYIKNYIDLQKIRFEESISLEFDIEGDSVGKKIAPLILIPFIENAFKHGVNAEEESLIKISIDIAEETLFLSVFNKKVIVNISEENKSGLGVENTKNRLELLYPEKHKLMIYDTKEKYLVELSMDLT